MLAEVNSYAKYKKSSAPWFGDIPEHWEMLRLGALLYERGETNKNKSVSQVLSLLREIGVIPYEEKGKIGNKRSDDISRYKIVRPNDIVINCMNVIIGSVGISRYTGCLSPVYYVLRPRTLNDSPEYMNYVFQVKTFQQSLVRIGNGILAHRMRIPMELLKIELLPRPPYQEQLAIVKYLNWTIAQTQKYISIRRRTIKALSEQREVIIQNVLARGLNNSVKLKSSRCDWSDDIPIHWNIMQLKHVLSRIDYGTSESTKAQGKIRILTMGNVQNGEIVLPTSGGLDYVPNELLLENNDILFTRTNGNPNLVGKVGIFRGELADKISFASYLVRLRVKSLYNPLWFHMLIHSKSFLSFARSHALVNLQTNLNPTRYSQLLIPVPPPAEQDDIVSWVDEETKPITNGISQVEDEILLLKEYQIRLIYDVVTGKLDVREAAKNLPAIETLETVESELPEEDDLSDELEEAEEMSHADE